MLRSKNFNTIFFYFCRIYITGYKARMQPICVPPKILEKSIDVSFTERNFFFNPINCALHINIPKITQSKLIKNNVI